MSTNGSETSSHIRQFGLYRTIDAKTEEFLKLSKKRQMKQGCACAAISTVITVAVVIIVLLIYEYMIAVETTFVQTKDIKNKTRYNKKETPIADRLDGNYFGVDQDYYEKIPLLINDLQESYIDLPEARTRSTKKEHRSINNRIKTRTSTITNKFVRRTRPRPFIYEYRSPYPMPFSKTSTNPKHWLEQYRNSQRLKNLRDVVKYLEKTLNAKFSDFHLPTNDMIFSELYIPDSDNINSNEDPQRVVKNRPNLNHYVDPLFIFKPDSPGEINLLADGLRFAPSLMSHQENNAKINYPRESDRLNCRNNDCLPHNKNKVSGYFIPNSNRIRSTSLSALSTKQKTFDHTSNYYSTPKLQLNSQEIKKEYKIDYDKIYLTTSKPIFFQFRRKSTLPVRRILNKSKSPRLLDVNKKNLFSSSFTYSENNTSSKNNIYDILKENNETVNKQPHSASLENYVLNVKEDESIESATVASIPERNSFHIEDYHIGSSGIIPIESSSTETYPIFTSVPPAKDIFIPNQDPVTTNPPDFIKFSPEDAKIPDQYLNLGVGIPNIDKVAESNKVWENIESTKIDNSEKEAKTLIIKLRNMIETTTEANLYEAEPNEFVGTTEGEISTTEGEIESTTSTYVPHINGHYRSVKNKTLMLLQENSEKYRKKRLENLLSIRNSTYVPMYVDIVRHRTTTMNSDYN